MQQSRRSLEQGFTLIELSIVLVIIGLIVGGVLVGQDLIKAAQIRATVTQLERYNTAANTFRGKYNGLPGDVTGGVNFFPSVTNQSTTAGAGNGDGLIQSLSASTPTTCSTLNCVGGENVLFWYELAQANYIPDAIGTAAANYSYTVNPTLSNTIVPTMKLGVGSVIVNTANGLNYWILASASGSGYSPPTYTAALTPVQAYQIDTKIDDGNPITGTVVSIYGGIPGTVADAGGSSPGTTTGTLSGDCTNVASAAVSTATAYNIASYANSTNCEIAVRTNF